MGAVYESRTRFWAEGFQKAVRRTWNLRRGGFLRLSRQQLRNLPAILTPGSALTRDLSAAAVCGNS